MSLLSLLCLLFLLLTVLLTSCLWLGLLATPCQNEPSSVCGWTPTDGQSGWRRAESHSHRLPVRVTQILDADWDDLWDQFDERRYLNAKKWRVGDDPYKLYAFNQRESERISSNRAIPDTRHLRYFLLALLLSAPPRSRDGSTAGLTCAVPRAKNRGRQPI